MHFYALFKQKDPLLGMAASRMWLRIPILAFTLSLYVYDMYCMLIIIPYFRVISGPILSHCNEIKFLKWRHFLLDLVD